MNREILIYKIIQTLNEEGALDINNYCGYPEQANDMYSIIDKCLDDYVIIEGRVV